MLNSILLLTLAQTSAITVDATKRTPISPFIYGVNHPDWDKLGGGFTLARQGGNRMTAYNWETNASNAGSDWKHQNDGYLGESSVPGWTVSSFVKPAQRNGAAALVTVPTAGYVSADKKGDGDVNQTPNYLQTRFHRSYARKNAKFENPPNTTDWVVYQDEFVAWLEKTKSSNTHVWYSLDNEPDLWGHTHQRIWQKNPTYSQIIANNIEFASAIKMVAPGSLVFGPANYGWQGFRNFQGAPDGNGRDFLDVYLAAMNDAESKAKRRLLDVLDIHWYPEAQGGGIRICFGDGQADKPETNDARIQAPRSLWDSTYVEESWITKSLGGKSIALLPVVQNQIKANYPGTKLAITEYNYGGANHISGAIAQADALGIFGRYGLFAAANWGLNANNKAELAGFRALIDYDRQGSRFGDLGLAVTGESAANESVYASLDSKNRSRLTLVVINKTKAKRSFSVNLLGYRSKTGKGYVISGTNFDAKPLTSLKVSGNTTKLELPAESLATIELRS